MLGTTVLLLYKLSFLKIKYVLPSTGKWYKIKLIYREQFLQNDESIFAEKTVFSIPNRPNNKYLCFICIIYWPTMFKYSSISVQFSRSVVSDSLWPHEPQHARPPCPLPTPGVHPNPCPSSRWCHPTISSSVVPFSSCPQPFPASGSFPAGQFLASVGQNTGVLASPSVLPMNTQDWSPLGWTGWISLQSKGLSSIFFNTTVQKHQFFGAQLSLWSSSHPYMTAGKTITLARQTFVSKVMSLLFDMLSRLVIVFLPKSKRLLISWLQSPSAMILESPKIKSVTVFHCFPIYLLWSDGTRCHDLSFLNVEL